jgi:hypothetical protein
VETTTGKTTQQVMFSLIEIWKSSGKTQREFCKEKGFPALCISGHMQNP